MGVKNRSISGSEGVQPLKLHFHFSFQLPVYSVRKLWESECSDMHTNTHSLAEKHITMFATISRALLH